MTTKPTPSETLEASQIVQRLIDDYQAKHGNEISGGVNAALTRIYQQRIKADERLLQPQPKRPRKPKAEYYGRMDNPQTLTVVDTPTGLQITADSKLKTGRNGR